MNTALAIIWAACSVVVGLVAYYGSENAPRTPVMIIGTAVVTALGPVIPLTIFISLGLDALLKRRRG